MTKTTLPDCIVSDRGGIIENTHQVHVAVTDAKGQVLFTAGNPSRMTLARSAAKPFQILALFEIPGFDQYDLSDADVALMCSSHSSEARHVARARAILKTVGASETDIQCGGHPAISDDVNRTWIKSDYTPTGIDNNCSAKHAGMLAGAKLLGTVEGYHNPDHPTQVQVMKVFRELSGLGLDQLKWGIDGCNLPAPALPLVNVSHLYAKIADMADSEAKPNSTDRTRLMARIYRCMSQYPELIGGEGRFCTELATAYEGRLIGKVGADGCYGIAIRASDDTRRLGSAGAMGIAVKVEDGDLNILYAAVSEVLEQLQIGPPDMRKKLSRFRGLVRLNTAGVVIGNVKYAFRLRQEPSE